MPDHWFKPLHVFDGQHLHDDWGVCVADGLVASAGPVPAGVSATTVDGVVTPGFVDLQVNGGGGVLFNQTPTVDGQIQIANAHHRLGTAAIMPTVITDAPDVLDRAVEAAIAIHGDPRIIGLHIEGPHISLRRRGTHAAEFIRPLDDRTIRQVETLRARNIPVMLTLAPEAATPDQITQLARFGAVVSLGHTDATAAQTNLALNAGAQCFTHLLNAMPPMLSRAPGVVGAAIQSDAYVGIICDGIHVADTMVALAIRARPKRGLMFIVSDAMPTVGGPAAFMLYGQQIRLQDGRLINSDGALAGAHTSMAQSVARLISAVGIPLEDALQMAITVPSQVIGVQSLATLVGRSSDDVMVLGPALDVTCTLADLSTRKRSQ